MSLQKTISQEDRPDMSYHKLGSVIINIITKEVAVILVGFEDATKKDNQKAADLTHRYIFRDITGIEAVKAVQEDLLNAIEAVEAVEAVEACFDFSDFLSSTDVRKTAYDKIKLMDEWKDSIDV